MQCPNDEKFAQYDEGKLSEDERFEFLQHLRECSDCSTLFAMTYGYICGSVNVCSNEEGISSLAEGRLSDGERETMLKHIAVCEKCSVELYLHRKSLYAKQITRKNQASKRSIYQLVAIAAVITLVIGFAGHNVLNRYSEINTPNMEQAAPKVVYDTNEISAAAPAPVTVEEPVFQSMPLRTDAKKETEDEEYPGVGNVSPKSSGVVRNIPGYMRLSMEAIPEYQKGDVTIICEIATLSYEVIYNGHDGDESEIIKLLQTIAGMDEERAKAAAKSRAIVIKEYASMEEAQRIKEALESAGAKIEINTK